MKYISSNNEQRAFFVPAGEYTVRILEAVETLSKSSGAEMIKLNLEVEGHGCRLFEYLIAGEATAWKIDAFRRALGETVEAQTESEITPQALIGKVVRARLRTEEFNGKTSNKVDAWLEPANATTTANPAASAQPEENEDVPF
jgi:hypothetical protein